MLAIVTRSPFLRPWFDGGPAPCVDACGAKNILFCWRLGCLSLSSFPPNRRMHDEGIRLFISTTHSRYRELLRAFFEIEEEIFLRLSGRRVR